MTHQSSIRYFWPSHRLWVKFFIGFVFVPLLFVLLFWLLLPALFLLSFYTALLLLLFVGGPISVGLFLSPGLRGVTAGLVIVMAIPIIWYVAGTARATFGFIGIELQLSIFSAIVIILLETMVGDVRQKAEFIGLATGLAVGIFLVFVHISLLGRFHYQGNDTLMLFSRYPPTALVWLNALFFPEWFSRNVGWGGVIVLLVLISFVFGLSFYFNEIVLWFRSIIIFM